MSFVKRFLNNWLLIIGLCLTLGLAPYTPEPHIWGKIKWITGGDKGMQLIDWWDTFIHGFPFILLVRLAILSLLKRP